MDLTPSTQIVTDDGDTQEFQVTPISDDQISEGDNSESIADIIALETREISGRKTAALAGDSLVPGQIIATVAIAGLSY